jgi:hypothetical protein
MSRTGLILFLGVSLWQASAVFGQDPKHLVQLAVQTELAADRDDHSRWLYFETNRKPEHTVKQWVAETRDGDLRRVIELNGQPISEPEQQQKIESFLQDTSARSKQRKGEQHDDQQATELLQMLPEAFVWTKEGEKDNNTILHFKPDPQFQPPDMEARVFAAMEGDMAVDSEQHRIVSLKGRLIHDVKILGGILGNLDSGGTFDVERRQIGGSEWQITETHVHIQGHVLIFKSISEQEDDEKTRFKQLSGDISMQQAKNDLLAQRK